MDKLYEKGLSSIFLMFALDIVQNYQLLTNFSHLDSSSFSVHGKYLINNLISSKQEEKQEEEKSEEPAPITITKGYSRDHRPDLKQFIIDLIVSGDGGIPLFLRVADGNEQDKVVFGEIAVEYKSMIDFETMIVADSGMPLSYECNPCPVSLLGIRNWELGMGAESRQGNKSASQLKEYYPNP